jgi:hypothetical protein
MDKNLSLLPVKLTGMQRLKTAKQLPILYLLKDPEALEAALEHAADRYGSIPNVKKEYFQTVGEILAYSLPKVLDEYNALSWRSCFRYILNTISSKVSQ